MYICTKTMKLGGEVYIPGDPIPENVILQGRAGKLIACGCITESEAAKPTNESAKAKEAEKQEPTTEETHTEATKEPKKKKAKKEE